MRKFIFCRSLIASAVICISLSSPGKANPVTLLDVELNEVLREAAQISGSTVVGAMLVSSEMTPSLKFSGVLPQSWSGENFCISMISADGLYEAYNTYTLTSEWDGGPVSINYPTKYPAKLSNLQEDELAIRTSFGTCEAQSDALLVSLSWRGEVAFPRMVRVFVNAFNADEVYIFAGDDPNAPAISCGNSQSGIDVSFDFLCDFEVTEKQTSVMVEINRVFAGQIAVPERVRIQLPPA